MLNSSWKTGGRRGTYVLAELSRDEHNMQMARW